MRNGIEGIAFDLDGTLYPNHRFNTMLLPFVLKETRLLAAFGRARQVLRKEQEMPDFEPFKTEDSFYSCQAEIVAKILGKPPAVVQEIIDRLIYKGWEPLFKKVKLYNNAIETLAALKGAGYKLALMSDFPTETKLEYMGLKNFPDSQTGIWDAVLCSEHCGALKPHPLPFIKLAGAMSLPPEKIMYVGNSRSYDVAGAARTGMKTAWIKPALFPGSGLKKPKANFVFSNYRKLYNYMV